MDCAILIQVSQEFRRFPASSS
ncbi:hypothetical protein CAEBREN_05340 [Caenorhabditis brenneri]|uniref:Uncharacterized protein n=1 Tax=Caenorhabditis brenneri TaxID=135651 RepID=G0MCS7_CAEBE|nr:hypothetical protein CAEBREN_05340 [Caenorhabditis brenneri]